MKELFAHYILIWIFFTLIAMVAIQRPRDIILIPIATFILPIVAIIAAPFLIIADLFGFLE